MMSRSSRLVLAAALLLTGGCLAACGGGDNYDEAAPTPTPVDPQEIVDEAVDTTSHAESFRLIIERSGAPVYTDTIDTTGSVEFLRAAGDYVAPNRVRVGLKIKIGGIVAVGEFIAIGPEQYLAHSLLTGGQWLRYQFAPGLDPANILSENGGLHEALQSVRNLEFLGIERLDGEDVYHLRGIGDGADVASLSLGLIGGGDVEVDAWVSIADSYVLRLTVNEPFRPLPEGVTEPPFWTFEFYDYNEALTVEEPEGAIEFAAPTATPTPTPTP